jgi:hypothetical protein
VDSQGQPVRVLGDLIRRVKRLRDDEAEPSGRLVFLFKAGKPALYRLEITFSDLSGKRLARYGEYLRVLEPKLDARLTLNGTTFKPGERVTARLNNYGTTTLSFGLDRSIDFFDGASWVSAPNSAQGPVLAIGLGLGPGGSAECWGFTIPPEEPPGEYRFRVGAGSVNRTLGYRGKPLDLSAVFHVVDSE